MRGYTQVKNPFLAPIVKKNSHLNKRSWNMRGYIQVKNPLLVRIATKNSPSFKSTYIQNICVSENWLLPILIFPLSCLTACNTSILSIGFVKLVFNVAWRLDAFWCGISVIPWKCCVVSFKTLKFCDILMYENITYYMGFYIRPPSYRCELWVKKRQYSFTDTCTL